MSTSSLIASVTERFPAAVSASHTYRGDATVVLQAESLLEVARFLKEDPEPDNLLPHAYLRSNSSYVHHGPVAVLGLLSIGTGTRAPAARRPPRPQPLRRLSRPCNERRRCLRDTSGG